MGVCQAAKLPSCQVAKLRDGIVDAVEVVNAFYLCDITYGEYGERCLHRTKKGKYLSSWPTKPRVAWSLDHVPRGADTQRKGRKGDERRRWIFESRFFLDERQDSVLSKARAQAVESVTYTTHTTLSLLGIHRMSGGGVEINDLASCTGSFNSKRWW